MRGVECEYSEYDLAALEAVRAIAELALRGST